MGDVIKLDDGGRIDVASQKILIRLREGGWTFTGDLRETTELSQNSQVLYRLEQHLIPAGFVEEAPREKENEFRKFQLTAGGQIWVDNHEEDLSFPASRAETQEMAYEAIEAAESAKSSVQSYRKKLYRMKKKVEELEEIEDKVEENAIELEYHSGSLSGLRERKADQGTVANVAGELVQFRDEMKEKHEGDVDRLGGRLDAQEMTVGEMQEEIDQLRNENARLRADMRELREEVDRGILEWLLYYFQGKR